MITRAKKLFYALIVKEIAVVSALKKKKGIDELLQYYKFIAGG